VTTVLLVDDQDLVRAGLRVILSSEPGIEVVAEAANGADAVQLTAQFDPDVVCMDVQMPGMDGLEATRAIVDAGSRAAVLMLTTFDRDDYLFAALDAGASGFLLKTASPEELVSAVQVLSGGDALLSPRVTRRVIGRVSGPPRTEVRLEELTDREHEVLRLVAQGLSNGEIATELVVGEATVKTHVSNVLMKLGLRDRIQAVILAYETGLVSPSGGS
jgi:DNA-binding NarL/FixJ family response regulator